MPNPIHDCHYFGFAILVSFLSMLGALFLDYTALYYDRTLMTTELNNDLRETKPTDEVA